jgi:hypothetical protein
MSDSGGKLYAPDGVSVLSTTSGPIEDPVREILCNLLAWLIGVEAPPSTAKLNKTLEEATEIVGLEYMQRRFAGKINIRPLTPEEAERAKALKAGRVSVFPGSGRKR